MMKTVHFNRNLEPRGHVSRWMFACVIHNQVLISTEVLTLAFLCLRGEAFTREYLNAHLPPIFWSCLLQNFC